LNDNFHLTWIPAILAQVYAIFLGPFWQVQLKVSLIKKKKKKNKSPQKKKNKKQ